MQELKTLQEIEKTIEENPAVLLYVSAPNCNVCDVLKGKIQELFKEFEKVKLVEANVAKVPQIQGAFNVFSAPTILLFFDGKEFAREGRNISLELFRQKVQKVYELYFG